MSEKQREPRSSKLYKVADFLATGGYSLLSRKHRENIHPEVRQSPEEIEARVEDVKRLVEVSHERLQGRMEDEWLLDNNLPDLYVAIEDLYVALGERELLETAQEEAKNQRQAN